MPPLLRLRKRSSSAAAAASNVKCNSNESVVARKRRRIDMVVESIGCLPDYPDDDRLREVKEEYWYRPYECLICEMMLYGSFQQLKKHTVQAHLGRMDQYCNQIYLCPHCGTRIYSTQRFIFHLFKDYVKYGGIRCEFPFCELGFTSMEKLVDHQEDCYWGWVKENTNHILRRYN